MAFTEAQVNQLRGLFNYSRDQLIQGSGLRTALSQAIAFDTAHGTTIEAQVKELLGDIEDGEAAIMAALGNAGVKRYDIYQEIETEYKEGGSAGQSLIATKQARIEEIRTLLDLDNYVFDTAPYARVVGINSNYGSIRGHY
jgi:hypothetical protein